MAGYLAHATGFPNINIVHLSSAAAVGAAMTMANAYPEVNFRREVTIGHLLNSLESTTGLGGKVNPPVRHRTEVDALWEAVAKGWIHWVISDHACCRDATKYGADRGDVFQAKAGFGGTEYILPGMLSEGTRRGIPLGRIAQMLCKNPAERFGFNTKGDIAVGYDADLVLVNPDAPWTVHAEDSESSQEYTPFEGVEMTHQVEHVWLRGHRIVENSKVVGPPRGEFVKRPTARA
jgi:allantoinase